VPVLGSIEGLFHILNRSDSYKRFKSSGASQAGFAALARDKISTDLQKLTMTPLRQNVRLLYNPQAWLELLHELGQLAEESTRVGVFVNLERAGLPWQERGRLTRESTQDFQRLGYAMGAINLITAFWGPWIGGLDRSVRMVGYAASDASQGKWNRPGRLVFGSAALALISYFLYQYGKDDERYRDAPDWERRTHWVFPLGDTTWLIPKGWDYPLLVANVAEMAAEYLDTGEVTDLEPRLKGLAFQIGTQNPIPNAILPAIEAYTGWSIYRGRPVVPARLQRLAPELQYTARTTEMAKRAGKVFGLSPMALEHFIRGTVGPMGINTLRLVDAGLRAQGLIPPPAAPEPAWSLDDWPGISRFVSRWPTTAARPVQRGFERWNAATAAHMSLEHLRKHGMVDDFRNFRRTHQAALIDYQVMKPYMEGRQKGSTVGPQFGIEDLYERIHRVEKAGALESELKGQRMDHLTLMMIRTMREALAAADAAQLNKIPIPEEVTP
jgi:hypothetical protein